MHIQVLDDVILATQVKDIPVLFDRIVGLRPGQSIRLAVDGVEGTWVKISMREPGGTRHALAPLGAMADKWASLQQPPGLSVELRILTVQDRQGDDYLRFIDSMMPEWNSPEDDEAFSGLRPL